MKQIMLVLALSLAACENSLTNAIRMSDKPVQVEMLDKQSCSDKYARPGDPWEGTATLYICDEGYLFKLQKVDPIGHP